jgi:hypothetical protein
LCISDDLQFQAQDEVMSNGELSAKSSSSSGSSRTVELALEAARQGAADASEAAGRVAESAGLFMARFVYTTCYTLSYGLVFPTMILARSFPRNNAAVQGLIDGASAATDRVESMLAGAAPVISLPGATGGHH